METKLRPNPSPKEKFRQVIFTFLLNLIFSIVLGLAIHSPAWLRFPLQNPWLRQYAGENGPVFLVVLLVMGGLGLLLSLIWQPKSRLVTIILCLLNIIMIALCALVLLGLFTMKSAGSTQILRVGSQLAVLLIGALNVRTLIYLDILGAITGSERN